MPFTGKTNVLSYEYRFENCFILGTDSAKDVDVNIDSELDFPHHVDFFTCSAVIKASS
jgi:hypothetical protein